jgi:hypothetical protein
MGRLRLELKQSTNLNCPETAEKLLVRQIYSIATQRRRY